MTVTEPVVELHPDRVRLTFEQADGQVKETRVPAGTTLFDAGSWNGVAIDSTCGGHGTCKKCKVRVASGSVPVSSVDPRAFSAEELKAGWRLACRAEARSDTVVEVPPLQTRPKAALAGVGRHVILRPAVQKRYLELTEPTMEDQTPDLERVFAAMDDVELTAPLDLLRDLGRTLRDADWKVTAVLCDDVLIDVEPGDTTARRFALAFDLGTTTVVANLLDLETGQPAAVRSMLNKQQPFGADVITRISTIMMDPEALGRLRAHAHDTLTELTAEVCEEAGVEPREIYEVVVTGNVTMIQIALGDRPGAAVDGAVHDRRADDAGRDRRRFRARRPPARAGRPLPCARRLRRPGHRRRRARDRADARPAAAAVHRRRHKLGDRARLLRAGPRDGRTGRACVRGGADPLRHARRRRRDRGREDPRRRGRADGDRRRRAGRHLRLGARGRGRRARRRRPARQERQVRPGRRARSRSGWARSARRTSSTSTATYSCRSATCASCSSRRRRSRPAGRSSAATSGSSRPRSSRCCSPARSARTCLPRAPSASASSPSWRCRGSSRPGTSRAKARRSSRCP